MRFASVAALIIDYIVIIFVFSPLFWQ